MKTERHSAAELLKATSSHLRGTLAEELAGQPDSFSKEASGLLKFHGVYQGDDRDLRKAGAGKVYSAMVRVSIPGGRITAGQYLALDRLADTAGDGTLRITSRQGLQYHRVGVGSLRGLIRAVNNAGLTTLAACGDVVRNVVCCAEPLPGEDRQDLWRYAKLLDRELKPETRAYAEIWLDGEKAVSFGPPAEEAEPLYGATYLPRKFKIGFAFEGDNTTDIYTHDLGFVPHFEGGRLAGFTMLAGGGLGSSPGVKETHPRLADSVAFLPPEDLPEAAKAVVAIHRDYGNRANRKLARLKYVIEEQGLPWFKAELSARLGKPLLPPRPLVWRRQSDYLGWHGQAGGGWFFGLRVVSGRISGPMRAAIRQVATDLAPDMRFTAQQNLILAGFDDLTRTLLDAILREHGVAAPAEMPPVLRHSMACPALPTCGLAVAEAERVLPGIVAEIQRELDQLGLGAETVHLRLTGCPNGCARPYTAEIGIVGQSPGLYAVYLGGSPASTRLARMFRDKVPQARLAEVLRPVFREYAWRRSPGESFGDYSNRVGVEALRGRREEAA
ncbi:MAG: NADPH-dependent assimilatory sulfite reductase hemoprotein subunit [Bryobacterales bacterium]|nr:NADPH-dependent assimilatory sulfite reductase hemoprotein subunit [Bryobacterales bacterium]